MTVVTSYGTDKHTYEIESIDFNKSPSDTFEMGRAPNAKTTSYVDYYREKYGKEVREFNQPMIISKN